MNVATPPGVRGCSCLCAGKNSRVLKEDVLRFIEGGSVPPPAAPQAVAQAAPTQAAPAPAAPVPLATAPSVAAAVRGYSP